MSSGAGVLLTSSDAALGLSLVLAPFFLLLVTFKPWTGVHILLVAPEGFNKQCQQCAAVRDYWRLSFPLLVPVLCGNMAYCSVLCMHMLQGAGNSNM